MDWISTVHIQSFHSIYRLSYHVHHASLYLLSRRHANGASRRNYLKPTLQTVGIVHGNTTNGIFTDMLLNFYYQFTAIRTFYDKCIINFRQHFLWIHTVCVKKHVNHRSDYLRNMSFYWFHKYFYFKVVFFKTQKYKIVS